MQLTEIAEDMSPLDVESLEIYRANGLPGLVKIEESDTLQWFTRYMSGHTYQEIAEATNKNKEMILYVSQRNQWHVKKMDYFNDLAIHFTDKSRQAKLESANTVLLANAALGKYIGEELQRFIKTGDKSIMENFDSKNFQNFLKAIEALDKMLGGGKASGAGIPKVDINLSGSNHKIEEKPEGIEITTKAENGDTLSLLASYKKAQSES